MGRKFRTVWDEEEIEKEIRKVMEQLDIKTMPSDRQIRLYGVSGLSSAIYRVNGINFWRQKIDPDRNIKRRGMAELTEKEVERCVKLREQGRTYKEIGDKFGMSINCTFRLILKEKILEGELEKEVEKVNPIEARKREVKKICEFVKMEKIKQEEEFKKQRLAEIENCRWKGVFKI